MNPSKIHVSLFAAVLLLAVACSSDSPAGGAGDGDTDDASINTDIFDPSDSEDDAVADADEEDVVEDVIVDDTGEEDTVIPDDTTEPEGLGRFEDCGFSGPRCEPPLQCMGTCQLPCSAECPEDEECIDLTGVGAAGICGVYVGVGEDCDFNIAAFCEEGLFCNDDGQCEAPTVAGEGDPCGGRENECEEGLNCVSISFNEGFCHKECEDQTDCDGDEVCIPSLIGSGTCYEDCDPPSDTECTDNINYECRTQFGSDETACFPRQGGPIGEQEFGEPCDNENRCAEDLICPPEIPTVLSGVYCTQRCDGSNPCPTDPAGAECVNLFIGQYCLFTCDGGVAECPEDMSCGDVFGTSICTW